MAAEDPGNNLACEVECGMFVFEDGLPEHNDASHPSGTDAILHAAHSVDDDSLLPTRAEADLAGILWKLSLSAASRPTDQPHDVAGPHRVDDPTTLAPMLQGVGGVQQLRFGGSALQPERCVRGGNAFAKVKQPRRRLPSPSSVLPTMSELSENDSPTEGKSVKWAISVDDVGPSMTTQIGFDTARAA